MDYSLFFSLTAPDLHAAAPFQFHSNVLQLSKVYKWEEAVLAFAIKIHIHITTLQLSDPVKWVIPREF